MIEEISMNIFNTNMPDLVVLPRTPSAELSSEHQSLTKFSENFWDDKLNGYFVLNQNLRNSQTSVKELELYLRERVYAEEQYVNQLNKITLQVQKFMPDSTLSPIWSTIIKDINEQNSSAHSNFMQRLQDLIKDIQAYTEDLRKKKKKVKEIEVKTSQLIDSFRSIRVQLAKSKTQYLQLRAELEKNKKLLEFSQSSNQATLSSNIQKIEKKTQLALEDYKQTIEKHNSIRIEYEHIFSDACNQYQCFEEAHLTRMRDFLGNYVLLINQLNLTRCKNVDDYQQKMGLLTVDRLLDQFILSKSTGQFRPLAAVVVDAPSGLSDQAPDNPITNTTANLNETTEANRRRSDSRVLSFFSMEFLSRIKPKRDSQTTNQLNTTNKMDLKKDDLSQSQVKADTSVAATNEADSTKTSNLYERVIKKARIRKSRLNSDPEHPISNLNSSGIQMQINDSNLSSSVGKNLDSNKKAMPGSLQTATSLDEENFKKIQDSDLDSEFANLSNSNTRNKDHADMTNLYESSEEEIRHQYQQKHKKWHTKSFNETENDQDRDEHDTDSDEDDSDDSDAPKRIILRIKPISEMDRNNAASPDVLNQISKNLQLGATVSTPKKKTYANISKNSIFEASFNQGPGLDSLGSSYSSSSVFSPRSTSAISFQPNLADQNALDENNNNSNYNNIPPPLPPLPLNIQLKINQRLNSISEARSAENLDRLELKLRPYTIKETSEQINYGINNGLEAGENDEMQF